MSAITSPQQAYNQIREYFTQPDAEFAVDPHLEGCRYLTPQGTKCAVGCLIPDDLYDEAFDGEDEGGGTYTVEEIMKALPGLFYSFAGTQRVGLRTFLEAAQMAHDQTAFKADADMNDFIDRLDNLARGFGLATPA